MIMMNHLRVLANLFWWKYKQLKISETDSFDLVEFITQQLLFSRYGDQKGVRIISFELMPDDTIMGGGGTARYNPVISRASDNLPRRDERASFSIYLMHYKLVNLFIHTWFFLFIKRMSKWF